MTGWLAPNWSASSALSLSFWSRGLILRNRPNVWESVVEQSRTTVAWLLQNWERTRHLWQAAFSCAQKCSFWSRKTQGSVTNWRAAATFWSGPALQSKPDSCAVFAQRAAPIIGPGATALSSNSRRADPIGRYRPDCRIFASSPGIWQPEGSCVPAALPRIAAVYPNPDGEIGLGEIVWWLSRPTCRDELPGIRQLILDPCRTPSTIVLLAQQVRGRQTGFRASCARSDMARPRRMGKRVWKPAAARAMPGSYFCAFYAFPFVCNDLVANAMSRHRIDRYRIDPALFQIAQTITREIGQAAAWVGCSLKLTW